MKYKPNQKFIFTSEITECFSYNDAWVTINHNSYKERTNTKMDREALGELIRKFPVYPEAFNLDDDSSVIDSYYKELNNKNWDKAALEAHIERWRVIWSIDAANPRNPRLTTSEWDIVKKTYNIDEVYPCFVAFMNKLS